MTEQQRVALQRDHPQGHQRIVFAHGAGAGLQSDFMQYIALGLAMYGYEVVRFNFPYWQQFMDTGVRRPPNPAAHLDHALQTVVRQFDDGKPLWLLGKSMGARVAFRCADALCARGAIALGYPFHPIGKPQQLRLNDLHNQCRRNLIIQGTRDSFGKPEQVVQYALPDNVRLHWLAEGDHSLLPTRRSGFAETELWQQAIDTIHQLIAETAP